jgi:hypothetical protein
MKNQMTRLVRILPLLAVVFTLSCENMLTGNDVTSQVQ